MSGLVEDMSLEALFEAEFEKDNSPSMEEPFSEVLENIEDAKKRVDNMQRVGVSSSNPVVENNTWALVAKGKGGCEE